MSKTNITAQRAGTLCMLLSVILHLAIFTMAGPAYPQTGPTASKPADVDEVAKWLRANAIPLKSVQAGAGFEDLRPLKTVLKDVKIIGLGEATHGTREFFQFKHRMTEFLVKEMGFTIFAIEASYPGCLVINDYVVYGKGDKWTALAGQGFWTWDTHEVMDLIDWMREYNKDLPEAKRIRFLGYDMQNYEHAYNRVYPYLQRVAPEYIEKIGKDFLPTKVPILEFGNRFDGYQEKLLAKINELIQYIAANKERFSKASSPREYAEAMQCAVVMGQFADTFSRTFVRDPADSWLGRRDYYMAKNTEYIMNSEGPNTKIVSWAHNGHISLDKWGGVVPAMGRHLRQMYGGAYYALGFTFNQGGFQGVNGDPDDAQAGEVIEFNLGPASEGTVDWYFARPGVKDYVVDFRLPVKPAKVAEWLAAARPMRFIGAGLNKKQPGSEYVPATVIKDHFDGMVFIDTTTRARPSRMGRQK